MNGSIQYLITPKAQVNKKMVTEECDTIYLGKHELSPAKSLGNAPLQ